MSKFHINKHGVPAPCRATKGNCPLGGNSGNENHFNTQEEAQRYVDQMNESQHGLLPQFEEPPQMHGSYVGNYYSISEEAGESLSKRMDGNNAKEIFDSAFENGSNIETSFEKHSLERTPVNFDFQVDKTGDNEYHIKGTMTEYEYVEKDFDTKEDYDEYTSNDPDTTHKIDYKFTGDELKEALVKHERIESGTHKNQTPGIVMTGLYKMTRDKIK